MGQKTSETADSCVLIEVKFRFSLFFFLFWKFNCHFVEFFTLKNTQVCAHGWRQRARELQCQTQWQNQSNLHLLPFKWHFSHHFSSHLMWFYSYLSSKLKFNFGK